MSENPKEKLAVLFVEDDDADAFLLSEMICVDDVALTRARTSREAVEKLTTTKFDCVIADLNLPDTRGVATIDYLNNHTTDTALIVLTGDERAGIDLDTLRHGAQDHLPKQDVTSALLSRSIRCAIERMEFQKSHKRRDRSTQDLLSKLVDGVLIVDRDGDIEFANDAAAAMLGHKEPSDVVGTPLALPIVDGERTDVTLHPKSGPELIAEMRVAKGEWLDKPVSIVLLRDITERKSQEQTAQYVARHDPLTGLANRREFIANLERALSLSNRTGRDVAVLFVDLDRFKDVNDAFGHAAGDKLLADCAGRLTAAARRHDVIGRLGGDEFVILLEDLVGMENAVTAAERIRLALAKPYVVGTKRVTCTASIGVTRVDAANTNIEPEQLLDQADLAMYNAKHRGRDTVCIFTNEMRDSRSTRVHLGIDVSRAVEQDELRLLYQPIVSMANGATVGVEALVRWERGGQLISPAQFIPVAEKTGTIVQIGRWALNTALEQCASWRTAFPAAREWRLHVNISAAEIADDDFVDAVANALERSGVPPRHVCLELTESAVIHDPTTVRTRLRDLSDRVGVSIAIDDFGTSYSSLTNLKLLPVDCLKIDRSFITSVTTDPTDMTIVRGIRHMANDLGLALIAEGVETIEQYFTLLAMGCDQAQGYLFSRPIPPETLTERLAVDDICFAPRPNADHEMGGDSVPPTHDSDQQTTHALKAAQDGPDVDIDM